MESKLPELSNMNLEDTWELYKVLRHCISPVGVENEFEYMINKMKPGTLMRCMNILFYYYPENLNPLEITMLVFNGLNANEFIQFIEFIRKVSNAGRINKI